MPQAIVLGAGMVGVGTALALQARGQDVVLIDRGPPGRETSYGNAGIIQTEAVEPYAMPRDLRSLLDIALGRTNDVVWHLRWMREHLGPLAAYFRHSAPPRHRAIARIHAALVGRAVEDHAPLIAAAGAAALIRRQGYLDGYRSPRILDRRLREAERIRAEYGVPFAALDGAGLARIQPGLRAAMAGGVHWTGPWTCRDPGGLVAAYAALFTRAGGRILQGDAATLAPAGAGWACDSAEGRVTAEHAVIALGPWSATLAGRLGYRVPLFRKRGYHWHFPSTGGPDLPMLDAENGIVIAPMTAGVRLTTGAEITGHAAPAHRRQIDRGLAAARDLFDLGPPVEPAPWFGHRPCLPDMLPLIGAAPRHAGLWFNFGHGHQGFTLGPTSGILLADLMTGAARPPVLQALGYRWRT